jgi:hypothetical protein
MTPASNDRITFRMPDYKGTGGVTAGEFALAQEVDKQPFALAGEVNKQPFAPDTYHVLYMGDSQISAIYKAQAGDLTAPEWLQVFLARDFHGARPAEVRVSSLRGATFLELLILAASYYHAGERIDLMVVETLPDEFDYGDPRQEIGDLLAEDGNAGYLKDFLSRNEGLEFARDTTTGMAVPRESSGAGDTLARRKWVVAFQEKLDGIASRWQLFHYRTRARAAVGYELVRLRAVLFNPWVDAAVPMCEDEFQYNSQALELLIRLAKEHHTQVVIYQAPVLGHKGVETDTFDVAPEDVEHTGAALREVCEKYAV